MTDFAVAMNSMTDRSQAAGEGEICSGGGAFRKWVSLTSDSDQFDIDGDRVSCRYAIADFMATFRGDAVVVEPAAFRFASQMVAHAIVDPAGDRCSSGGRIQIAVRRQSVRCARPYLFAYVDGRHYEVMGVSEPFTFTHRDGQCDCGTGGGDGGGDSCSSATTKLPTTISNRPTDGTTGDFVSSGTEEKGRYKALQCSACQVPSNHREVLENLMKNISYSSDVDNTTDSEHVKKIECLKNCKLTLEYQYFKINMLTEETEDCQRFVNGLVSSLLKNHKATLRVGNNMICVKRQKSSANEHFMQSIINFQKETISNLSTTHKKILVLINITQLFYKV
uniref:SKICH domain-containing protein n=1 Tax=Sipha flava TaxID=143950 RepID=A0A2S2R6P2_9HEMI